MALALYSIDSYRGCSDSAQQLGPYIFLPAKPGTMSANSISPAGRATPPPSCPTTGAGQAAALDVPSWPLVHMITAGTGVPFFHLVQNPARLLHTTLQSSHDTPRTEGAHLAWSRYSMSRLPTWSLVVGISAWRQSIVVQNME